MKAKVILVLILVLVVLGGLFWYFRRPEGQGGNAVEVEEIEVVREATQAGSSEASLAVKEIQLGAKNFEFSQKEIRVPAGQRVRVVLSSEEGLHDWVVDEFAARTERVGPGEVASVEFVADKTGEFEYYCSVGNHRALGMVGTLLVE